MISSTSSPCIGFCSTTYGDDYCRGCYRHVREVLDWRQLDHAKKELYYYKVAELALKYMQGKVEVYEPALLRQTCQLKGLPYFEDLNPYYHILRLLQKGFASSLGPESGVILAPPLTWAQIYKDCDHYIYNQRIQESV